MDKPPLLVLAALAAVVGATAAASRSPWTGPELQMVQTAGGGYPALRLDDAAVPPYFPPFWFNLNNQGNADLAAIATEIIRAREAGLKVLSFQSSDGLVVPPVSAGTAQIMGKSVRQSAHLSARHSVRWS